MRKTLFCALMATVLTISTTGMCFAASVVPAKLTIPDDAVTRVDINIGFEDADGNVGGSDGTGANGILMTGSKGVPTLAVETLTVQNNNTIGKVVIDNLEATGIKDANGDTWTIVADDTDFINMDVDQHKFSLIADGTHDMTSAYHAGKVVLPQSKQTVSFTGKTGPVTKAYTAVQVANLVVTVAVV